VRNDYGRSGGGADDQRYIHCATGDLTARLEGVAAV